MNYAEFVRGDPMCPPTDDLFAGNREVGEKSVAECEALCVNSLICPGILYGSITRRCILTYRSEDHTVMERCPGDMSYFHRRNTLTKRLTTTLQAWGETCPCCSA